MSIKQTNLVINQSPNAGSVYLVERALADQCNDEGRAFASIVRLAKMSRVSDRTVRRCLSKLEKQGRVIRNIGAGRNGVNEYLCNFEESTLEVDCETQIREQQNEAFLTLELPTEPEAEPEASDPVALSLVDRWLSEWMPPGPPPNTKQQEGIYRAFVKLLEDGIDLEDIERAIIYAREDDFWKTRFLSPTKLLQTSKGEGVSYLTMFLAKARVARKDLFRPKAKKQESPVLEDWKNWFKKWLESRDFEPEQRKYHLNRYEHFLELPADIREEIWILYRRSKNREPELERKAS